MRAIDSRAGLRWVLFWSLLLTVLSVHSDETVQPGSIWALTLDDVVGPASADYLVRGIDHANEADATAVLLTINTPGGLDSAMRAMISAVLASDVPVLCYVSPSGARAASAGTYLLYACHLAAMAPATNLGAATPVSISTPISPSPGSDGGGSREQDGERSSPVGQSSARSRVQRNLFRGRKTGTESPP